MRIATPDIDEWLSRLSAEAEVFVPQRRADGAVVLGALGEGERALDYRVLAESPRRIMLPQSDEVVQFEQGRARPVLDDRPRVLSGLRPCDAAAIAILDEFFRRDYADPNYLSRRQRTRLIVLACEGSDESCFCASTETGPVAAEGFDVQLFDMGGWQLAQIGSAEGEALVAAGGQLFAEAPAAAPGQLKEFRRAAQQAQSTRLDLRRIRQIILNREEPDDFWQRVADRCLMCGGCAYLCPTCTCYDIADVVESEGSGLRRRVWDSCVLEGFTREASGHNPRQQQPARCEHRYFHKIADSAGDYPFRCVGCGRCTQACLTRLGMIRLIGELLDQAGGKA